MSTRRSPVRPIAIVLMVAVVVAFFLLRRKPEEKPHEEVAAVAEPEPEEAPEPPPAPAEEPAPPTPKAAPAVVADEAPPPPAPSEAPSEDAGPPEPLSPPLREHALLMITPMAKMAMESGDVAQLKALRDMMNERKQEKLMSAADLEALELSIGCLERSPEAREEARDLIDFGTPTMFGDSFAKACGR